MHEGPPPPPRPPKRLQREILFRILLSFPSLIDDVAEELAALEIPDSELKQLQHEILAVGASRPGLDARELRQHLVQNGLAATVENLLLPSVDTAFLVRCCDPISARKEWVRVTSMLTGGDRCALAEATNDLIVDVSPESWQRLLSARERALRTDAVGEDQA